MHKNSPHDLKKMLRIHYPVIQAPMLGVVTPELAAAAGRAEVLGSLPVGYEDYEDTVKGLKNRFTEIFESPEDILPYPFQNKLTAPLRNVAKANGQTEWLSIWCGQAYKNLSFESAEDILKSFYN